MQPLKYPAKYLVIQRNISRHSALRAASCSYTLHKLARRYAATSSLSSHHPHPAHHVSLTSGPTLPMFTPNNQEPESPQEISDQEWEIRTGKSRSLHLHYISIRHRAYDTFSSNVLSCPQGRAIYVLQQTLPDFFQLGLVANIDPTTGPDIVDVRPTESENVESIYSPTIRLSYTPPVALPPPFPRTLSLEGLPLYMASSVFIRHTMKTLYSDLRVELRKLVVQTPSSSSLQNGPRSPVVTEGVSKREKSVFVGLSVHGTARVSGGLGEWQIDSTYTFSPLSGLIQLHTIDSIHPAPHQAAYDALRASLSNVFGIGERGDVRPGQVGAVDRKRH